MNYLTLSFASYLIGSVPCSYLIVKAVRGFDLTRAGSGNVGAMNSYETTGKKWIGVLALLCDSLKGVLSVYLAFDFFSNDSFAFALAGIFAVLGHNFSIFLKFKGGRGLATALGVFLFASPAFAALWGLIWIAFFKLSKKDFHVSNASATILTPLFFFLLPNELLTEIISRKLSVSNFELLYLIVCLLILVKHVRPLRERFEKSSD